MPEAVRHRGRHRAALPGSQVSKVSLQPARGVVQVDANPVTRVHYQVLAEIGVHGREIRRREGPGEQRIGRRLRHAALGDVSPVDGSLTAENEVVTRAGVEGAGVLVKSPAVDGHRRAVHGCAAAEALELWHVTRTVELQLHEGSSRVAPDVTG